MEIASAQNTRKLKCVVADSGAFLKNVPLHNFGDRIFTISDVVGEIRDSATRARLTVLPYTVEFREPSLESIKYVTEFSKKTGDYKSLSAVDLRVIALSHQLEKEFCSADHIQREPAKKVNTSAIKHVKPPAGFYSEKQEMKKGEKADKVATNEGREPDSVTIDSLAEAEDDGLNTSHTVTNFSESGESNKQKIPDSNESEASNITDAPESHLEIERIDLDQDEGFDDDVDEDSSEDDGGDWICPQNIQKVKSEMGIMGDLALSDTDINSACFTLDFAMQNVLIQMGLHVMSVNGMLIRQARSYILKCYGCFKESTEMDRRFCHHCGNETLMKISVTTSADGTIEYHYPKRRNISLRGTKFSVPLPKGGRSGQASATRQQRLPKKKDNPNALDPDFVARASPFAMNDVTSRAFQHGYHLRHRDWRNPNENKKRSGKKRK